MLLNEFINTLNDIFLSRGYNLDLNPSDFEMGLMENIPNTEVSRWTTSEIREAIESDGILAPNLTSRGATAPNRNAASHFFISSNSRPMFTPFIDQEIDSNYALTFPFKFYGDNLNLMLQFLPNNYYSDERIEALKNTYSDINSISLNLSVKLTGTRTMFSSKSLITPNENRLYYRELRYSIFETDYLVILKKRQELKYVIIYLPNEIAVNSFDNIREMDGQLMGELLGPRPFEVERLENGMIGENVLIFGAPGTGKSNYIKNEYEEDSIVLRVVFHEEYSYQDFVGSIKPLIQNDRVSYAFSPGPFTNILTMALNNPSLGYTLIIEELNRANAATVFGDIFQLLDRDEHGVSEYSIFNFDVLEYINKNGDKVFKELRLPNNLNIVATMNSADQGVFPLDTAFKRRWNYVYMPIEFKTWHDNLYIRYFLGENMHIISVRNFLEILNNYLGTHESLEINEDRLIGSYFLKEFEWRNWVEKETYKKILVYLWDDVVRLDRQALFKNEFHQYKHVYEAFKNSEQIFVDDLHVQLMNASIEETG